MSSFIVSNKSIHAIVTKFIQKMPGNKFSYDAEKLGQALLTMNTDAVNVRYPKDKVKCEKYKYSSVFVNDLAAYKVVSCYIYQCSESDEIMGSDLYEAVEQLKSILADSLISRIPGFDDFERDL